MIWFFQRMNSLSRAAMLLAAAMLLTGCAQDRPTPPTANDSADAGEETEKTAQAAMDASKEEPAPPIDAAPEPEPKAEPEYNLADVGADDAQAGSTIGGGILTEPLHQRFHVAHRIEFIKIDKAMSLYQATNGYYPKSHEEFMEKIIRENAVTLPELRDGWDYFYDAEDHTLKKRKET